MKTQNGDGAEAQNRLAADALRLLADGAQHSLDAESLRTYLSQLCEAFADAADAELPGTTLSSTAQQLIAQRADYPEIKSRRAQQQRAEEFLLRRNKTEQVRFTKRAAIEAEKFAVETLLEKGCTLGEVASYMQHRYGERLKAEGLSPFSRADIYLKRRHDKQKETVSRET